MIATVTLNPAVDKTVKTSRVILGNVNRGEEVKNIAGGKGINVARVLKLYGEEVKCLGFNGGYLGQLIKDSIEGFGAEYAFTSIQDETRVSVNIISEDGYVTEFLEPGPQITEDEISRFITSFEEETKDCEIIILSGSLPRGVSPHIYADLIERGRAAGKKVFLDSSGEALKKGMYARPFFIKPNIKELETMMGRRVQGMQEVCEAAEQLIEWGIPNVMISLGSKGILYAIENEGKASLFYIQAPSIKAVNTVGSGDSVVAAFTLSYLRGDNPEETLKNCVAISVANAMSMENGIIDPEAVERIKSKLELCVPIV